MAKASALQSGFQPDLHSLPCHPPPHKLSVGFTVASLFPGLPVGFNESLQVLMGEVRPETPVPLLLLSQQIIGQEQRGVVVHQHLIAPELWL